MLEISYQKVAAILALMVLLQFLMFGCQFVIDSLRSEHWPEGDGGEVHQAGGRAGD